MSIKGINSMYIESEERHVIKTSSGRERSVPAMSVEFQRYGSRDKDDRISIDGYRDGSPQQYLQVEDLDITEAKMLVDLLTELLADMDDMLKPLTKGEPCE